MWPLDKLAVINSCLAISGDNLVSVADDGSTEWNTASEGYEAAIPYMIEGHDWKFGTLVSTLTPAGNVPTDPLFDTAYAKPQELLHLIWARLGDVPVNYQVLNNQIVVARRGSNAAVTAKYVRQPGPEQVTPTFMMALRAFVMSAIYRGLHEDAQEGDKLWAKGEQFLAAARTRSDQEAPKRAPFNSRVRAARRSRGTLPVSPFGWGGTGSAS